MRTDNYPPDHDPRLDSGEDEIDPDLIGDYDDSDEYRERLHEEAHDAITGLGIPEDEADNLLEDMGI